MKTKDKIRLAGLLYRATHAARAVVGKTDHCICRRRGVRYELDLSEGIDFAIYLGAAFEAETIRAISRYVRPGATVLDIGANIGAITMELAKQVGPNGRVFAFEPTTFAFTKLSRNLELNPELAERTTVEQVFLGASDDGSSPEDVYSSWPLGKQSGDLHAKHLGRAMPTHASRTRQVDKVLLDHGVTDVDLVKLDVDGFECAVLEGAQELLSNMRPTFLVELAPYVHAERGYSFDQFVQNFTSRGYGLIDQKSHQELPSEPSLLAEKIGDGASINAIAIPS